MELEFSKDGGKTFKKIECEESETSGGMSDGLIQLMSERHHLAIDGIPLIAFYMTPERAIQRIYSIFVMQIRNYIYLCDATPEAFEDATPIRAALIQRGLLS